MYKIRLAFWAIVALMLGFAACSPSPKTEVHLQGQTMGTTYNVKYVPTDESQDAPEALKAAIDERLVQINQLMSTYDSNSELSRFNQQNSTQPFAMSAESIKVLKEAIHLGELSGNVLDVTVGPLVNLWGFGPQAEPEKVPEKETIAALKQNIGLDKLSVSGNTLVKSNADLYVDLSPIAKGYGVDQIAELLLAQNISDFLVEIGGEMRLSGKKADGTDWMIAIEKPVTSERAVQKVISVGDNAVATSGDYRNYYERDGVRYSHLIDPRSGYPIQHNLVSVTVIHSSSMTADGLATALIVMGKEAALALAERENIAAMLVTKEAYGFKEYTSHAFEQTVKIIR